MEADGAVVANQFSSTGHLRKAEQKQDRCAGVWDLKLKYIALYDAISEATYDTVYDAIHGAIYESNHDTNIDAIYNADYDADAIHRADYESNHDTDIDAYNTDYDADIVEIFSTMFWQIGLLPTVYQAQKEL